MIPFTEIEYNDGSWRFVWTTGLGSVRVVLWGQELAVTEENEYVYSGAIYGSISYPPPIEVILNDGTLTVTEYNDCFMTLQWHRVDCRQYIIEGKDGGVWQEMQVFEDDDTVPVFTYITPLLADQFFSEWRVTATDEKQREGAPLEFVWNVVRPPNPPTNVQLSCAAGVLTVE